MKKRAFYIEKDEFIYIIHENKKRHGIEDVNVRRFYARRPKLPIVLKPNGKPVTEENPEFRYENENGKRKRKQIKYSCDNRLGQALMLLVKEYSKKNNLRGYGIMLEDMQSNAYLKLLLEWHKCSTEGDENPFNFYTTIIMNSFNHSFNIENKQRGILDEIKMYQGLETSEYHQRKYQEKQNEDKDEDNRKRIEQDKILCDQEEPSADCRIIIQRQIKKRSRG